MQEYSVKVTLPDGQVMAVTASESDTLEAVADRFKDYYEDDIILGIVNGRLRELNKKIKSDCELSFVTTADRDGRRTYRRSVVLLLQRAIYDVYGSMTQLHVMHSLGEGYYCQLEKAEECADSQQEKHSSDNQGSSENSVQSVTEHDIDRINMQHVLICGKRPTNYQAQCKNTVCGAAFQGKKGSMIRRGYCTTGEAPESISMSWMGWWIISTDLWHPRQACSNTLI